MSFYNMNGSNITFYFSGLQRAVFDVVRTLLVWGVGLVVSYLGIYQWESLNVKTNMMKVRRFYYILL